MDEFDDYDDYLEDDFEENIEAENCCCGAYKMTSKGWKHVADCCC